MSRLNSWLPRTFRASKRSPIRRKALSLTRLEAREVPAAFSVTTTFNNGAGTLRQAILDANANGPGLDTITFDIPASSTITLLSEMAITGSVIIDGSAVAPVISGNNVTRIFNINNPSSTIDVTLRVLNLTKANAAGDGGAVRNVGENVTIDVCGISKARKPRIANTGAVTGESKAKNLEGPGAPAASDSLYDVFYSNALHSVFVSMPTTNGADTFTLRRNAGQLELVDGKTAGVVVSHPIRAARHVYVMGAAGEDDRLVVDYDTGLTASSVFFNGQSGFDELVLRRTLGADVEFAARYGALLGARRFEGQLGTLPSAGAVSLSAVVVDAPVIDTYAVSTEPGIETAVELQAPAGKAKWVIQQGPPVPFRLEVNAKSGSTFEAEFGGGDDVIAVRVPDQFSLASGQLVVSGGAGNDAISSDTVAFNFDKIGVRLNGGAGNDTIGSNKNGATIDAGSGDDVVNGGAGGDTVVVNPTGTDVFNDGGGRDTLDFSTSGRGVTIDLNSTAAQSVTPAGYSVQLAGPWENFIGSIYNDTITAKGQALPRSIDGGPQVIGVPPGDALTVDAAGKSAYQSGSKVSLFGFGDITYTDIESFTLANVGPPTSSVTIDSGVQRSMVRTITVTFSEPVVFTGSPAAAFQLQRLNTSSVPSPSGAVTIDVSPTSGPATVFVITITDPTFAPGAGAGKSLIDGRYRLVIDAAQIKSAATGQVYDGDGNGTAGDNQTTDFHRLFGDANGDGFTDLQDFVAFRAANGSQTGQGNFNPAFDANGDGFVDLTDFVAFRQRLGLAP